MWKKITTIIDEWCEKHGLFVFWLWSGIFLGLVTFFDVRLKLFGLLLFWCGVVAWVASTVALIALLYKWIADLVEGKTATDKKLDVILDRLSMRCTNIPSHKHPPWDVTYSVDNLDDGSGWGAYAYHCVKLPCGCDRRAGEKREWIIRSVEVAERDGFEPCKLCFKAHNL